MNLIQIISNNLAHKMVKKVPLDQIEYAWEWITGLFPQLSNKFDIKKIKTTEELIGVYNLALMVPVGAVFKGLSLILLSLILGVFWQVIVVVLTFMSLRSIAGGAHFSSYVKCVIFSLIQFLGIALIAKYIFQYWSHANLWNLLVFCILTSLYIIIKYVPRDSFNKPITKVLEIKKFKRWSFLYLVVWIALMTILLFFKCEKVVLSSCFGLLLELFTVSKMGYKSFCKINQINNKEIV